MPIFPRYSGISTNVDYDKAVEAPTDPRPRQIQALGAATEEAAQTFAHVARKRQELEDEAETQKRYMQAVTDMESMTEQLSVPANAIQAKSLFGKHLTEREGEWFKGLNGRQADMLKKRLFPKQIEYQVGAGKLENRARLEDYSATMVRAESLFAQKAARRVGPDDASETSEYQDYKSMVDKGVAVGYIRPEKGEEMKDAALKRGAFTRVYQVTASENRAEVQHVLDLYKQEAEQEGSTFLRHIDPKERIELEKQLKSRLHSLDSEEQRKAREAREDTARMNKEMSDATTTLAAQKLKNPDKYGTLTREWVDLAADLRLMSDKDYEHFISQVEKDEVSGGPGNPETLRRYSIAVFDTSTPAQAQKLRDELKADIAAKRVPGGPNSIGSQWLNHLEEKAKTGKESGPPSMASQTDDYKQRVKIDLRVTGPMAAMNDAERAVLSEAIGALDRNAAAGYPKTPAEVYDENIDKWQARVGVPGKFKSNELRRSIGLPPRLKGGTDETLETKRTDLQREFQSAPPGPEGDAVRASVRERARVLRRLQQLEQQLDHYEGQRGQSRAAREEQKKNTPLAGPRK